MIHRETLLFSLVDVYIWFLFNRIIHGMSGFRVCRNCKSRESRFDNFSLKTDQIWRIWSKTIVYGGGFGNLEWFFEIFEIHMQNLSVHINSQRRGTPPCVSIVLGGRPSPILKFSEILLFSKQTKLKNLRNLQIPKFDVPLLVFP